jgi:hypothetical protein
LFGYLSTASAGPPFVAPIEFWTLHNHHGRPVAGQVFEGLAVTNRSGVLGTPQGFSFVNCDGEIAGKRLTAQKLSFGYARSGEMQVVVCGWRIPADAGGKKLRLWDEHRAWAQVGNTNEGSPEYVWGVKKRR